MAADPPELTTNAEWRRIMSDRRKHLKLSQKELGAQVGTSQNMISNIEAGEVTSSKFILAISKKLQIPPPMHFESEEQKTWSELGHLLRNKSMKKFRAALAMVETMIEDDEDDRAAKPKDRATSHK